MSDDRCPWLPPLRLASGSLLLLVIFGCSRIGTIGGAAAPGGVEKQPWPPALLPQAGWVEIPLVKGKDGLFEMDVEVRGEKLVMLLDTGAACLVLDHKLAGRLELPLEDAPYPAGGLGSSNVASHLARLGSLKVGPYTSVPVDAWVMDLSTVNASRMHHGNRSIDGLIGAAFLEFHLAVIDYPLKKLYLRPRKEGGVLFPRAKTAP